MLGQASGLRAQLSRLRDRVYGPSAMAPLQELHLSHDSSCYYSCGCLISCMSSPTDFNNLIIIPDIKINKDR